MRWIVLLLILMLPVYGYALDVGDAAPDFEGVSLDNKQISLYSSFVGEKPVYLIFWATW
jgi:peroxiredoxin